MNGKPIRTVRMHFRHFVAHTTHIEIAWTEEDVECLQPFNPFAIPGGTSR